MTPAEFIEHRLLENERQQRKVERDCESIGHLTVAGAAALTELSLEHEALSERLAEITA